MKSRVLCDGPPSPRIAILRALQLGDLLCAVPAFRALRASLPQARISLIGLPWARTLVERYSMYLDDFYEFPGHPALPERVPRLDAWTGFLLDVQSAVFDLVIQMHGSGGVTNPLAGLLGGRHIAGYYRPGQFCPDSERFLTWHEDTHEVRRHLQLMEFLGVPSQGEALEFPVQDADRERLRQIEGVERLTAGEYVCLHPGARALVRRWPPKFFAAVADELANAGLQIVLTASRAETELTRSVAQHMHAPAFDLAGRTDLGALGALFEDARLVICNDTGVAHLATATHTPSVVIFHEQRQCDLWGPLDRQRHRPLCPPPGVRPEAVLAEARDLLMHECAGAFETPREASNGSADLSTNRAGGAM